MPDYGKDTRDDDQCAHIWRVFDWNDRCVLCGDERPHPPRNPYTWMDGGGAA